MNLARAIADQTRVRTSEDEADRVAYARDLWPRHLLALREGRPAGERPACVVWPTTTEEVSAVVRFCAAEGVPLVPYGAGSGVCGGILPDARTVVLDLKRMQRWRAFDRESPTLDVESGAMGITLEQDVQREGFTIGHFPSSILCSTVGGWVAARGAGQASGKYGKIEDMVVDLELVDGRGEVSRLHRRRRGGDLVPLVIGSEGTLGVITSARLRLHAAPAAQGFASYAFRTTEEGWDAIRTLFQAGLRPAVARLYDPFDAAIARMGGVKKHTSKGGPTTPGASARALRSVLSSPAALNGLIDSLEGHVPGDRFDAMLVLVFEGTSDEVHAGVAAARALLRNKGKDLGEGPAQRWLVHRYAVSYRQPPSIRAGLFIDTMEVAAPWSRLGELYRSVRETLGRRVFVMAHLSHAYPDGCSIYFTFAGAAGEGAGERYDQAWSEALGAAIAAGGTLSHHHGVGRSKAPRLGAELGVGVDLVRMLQRAFDPHRICNPGNLVPDLPPHPGAPRASLPTAATADAESLLVHAPATATLAEVEAAARSIGASLRLDSLDGTVGAYVDAGCPGAVDPFSDPVDHALAGLDAELPDGRILRVRPCPRRAVGPDLMALVEGAEGRFLRPLAAHLRVHPTGARAVSVGTLDVDRSPPVTPGERALLEHVQREVGTR
ncbi:MAG: FAD-binding oxidoreductase [Myxococcales bacterium]|nr:FAD-binding oxidoreductase [Myxococcales bacterium]